MRHALLENEADGALYFDDYSFVRRHQHDESAIQVCVDLELDRRFCSHQRLLGAHVVQGGGFTLLETAEQVVDTFLRRPPQIKPGQ